MPIGTVYPERGVNENLRFDMNRIIWPSNHAFQNKIPIYIMWSPLVKKSKAYNVKHFVVLLNVSGNFKLKFCTFSSCVFQY